MLLSLRVLPLLALAATLAGAAATPPASRPNLLWVVSEDNNPQYIGAYGDPLAHTPRIDALARAGVRYTNAHSPAPVCAPSRASLITGRAAPGLGTQHMRSTVPLPEGLRYYPSFLREAGYYCTNNAKTDYNAATVSGSWDKSSPKAHWRNRAPGQPFFAVFNFNASHESALHQRLPLKTDPARVRVPPYLPDTPEVRADIAQYYDRLGVTDRQIGELLDQLEADGLADDTIVFYYSDNGGVLPRSKRFLYDNGSRVPLVIHFPKKFAHLAPAASGSVNPELVSLLDLPPTLCSLAGLPVPAQFEGRAIAGPARGPEPRYLHVFRDRMDECYDLGRVILDRRWRYIRNYRPELPAGRHLDYLWKMASMRDWDRLRREGKLNATQSGFFAPRPAEELYDVAADPDNVHNLASDPANQEILERMRAANRAHLLATRDLGFMPESMIRRLAGEASPVALGRDPKGYPLEFILDEVDRLQLPARAAAADFDAAFRDSRAAVRYWGAAAAGAARQLPAGVTALLQDSDESVRVAAAAALLFHHDDANAWEVLASAIGRNQQAELRLEALDVVATLPRWPEPLRPALEAASRTEAFGVGPGLWVPKLAQYLLTRQQ